MLFILKYFFITFFLLLGGAIYYFCATEEGLKKEIILLAQLSNNQIKIEQASGTLFSTFQLKNISFQFPKQQGTIQSLHFTWDPTHILVGKFFINHITMDNAKIVITKIAAKKTENKKIDLRFLNYIIIKNININALALQYGNTKLDATIQLTDQWKGNWECIIPNLEVFLPNSKGALSSIGTLSGPRMTPIIDAVLQAQQIRFFQHTIGKINGKININLQPETRSHIELTANNIQIKNNFIKKFDTKIIGDIQRKPKALSANFSMDVLKKYFITAQLTLPNFTTITDLKQMITGKIDATTRHLDWLTDYIKQIKNPRGILKGQIHLTGTLEKPTILAEANLLNGAFHIPELGATFDRINLNAKTDALKTVNFIGRFTANKGTAQLQGSIDLTKKNLPISATLQGNQLSVVNLPEYQITISPNIKLIFFDNNLQLQGSIAVPEAKIMPKNFNNVISLPSEVVFVGQPKSTALPFSMTMQLAVQLGKNIYIDYNNLKTQLNGSLQIIRNSNSPAIGSGELYTSNGTYQAYGQTLAIQAGRIIFTGGQLTNPGLNIRAVRTIKTINLSSGINSFSASNNLQSIYMGADTLTVGVQVQGTVNTPIVTLISVPAGLSQNDILSYLMFGYPQSQISSRQAGTVLSALSAVGFDGKSQFSSMTEKLQNSLGLTELNVQSTDMFNPSSGSVVSTTSFVIGKQLGNNLSIHYSIGLFDHISVLNLRYQLSKHFAVQSETSSIDNGADLLYEFEKE